MSQTYTLDRRASHSQAPLGARLAISERRLLLCCVDLLSILGSVIISLTLWANYAAREIWWLRWQEQALWTLFIHVGWGMWLLTSRMYDLQIASSFGTSARKIISGGFVIALAYALFFFFTSPVPILGMPQSPRLAPGLSIIISTGLLATWRWLYTQTLCSPQTRRRMIILGAGAAGTTLSSIVANEHPALYQLVGFVDDDEVKQQMRIADAPVLGGHAQLLHLALKHHIDEIVLAISAELRGSLFQAIMDCNERGITITPMPLLYERLTGRIAVEHIGSQWYIALPFQQHIALHIVVFIKRLGDVILGLLGGLLFLIALPLIALAIKLDTPGPIFYNQERAGLSGRSFRVRKFRSMVQDAEKNGQPRWAIQGDDRITRVGQFLRKTRLDELPQVLNILRGEMSLVGPRPERPQFIEQLQHQIPFYRSRLAVKPGLTGWAQINYGYGSTTEDALIKLQYDLYYIKHQSPWLDTLILLRTIGVVLKMKGR